MVKIGKLIKYYRTLHQMTQYDVAEQSGINEKYFGRLERDESVPTIDKVEKICSVFNIGLSQFFSTIPNTVVVHHSKHKSVYPNVLSKFIYNCNCCGYEFNEGIFCDGDMLCPECGCRYDEENGYIVKDGE